MKNRLLAIFLSAIVLLCGIAPIISADIPKLQVTGGRLCDMSGTPVQLKGMSSHGLQWFPWSASTVQNLKSGFKCSVVRAAMYTKEGGYIDNPNIKNQVITIVDAAINQGIYVIIDWHILSDNNPNTYRDQAVTFFRDMATRYGNTNNVLYEICNEPNGSTTWANIKTYADYVIPQIRSIDPDNIIIVGTPTWSRDVDIAADSPLTYSNVMYTLHFYSGSHGQSYRDKANYALSRGLAIFITEWGTSLDIGDGGPYLAEADLWMSWADTNKLSWCNWSLCNKAETSAALKTGVSLDGPWSDANLTQSGAYIKSKLANNTLPPNSTPTLTPATTPTPTPTPVPPGSDYVIDNFESGLAAWTTYQGSATVSIATATGNPGSAMVMNYTSGDYWGAQRNLQRDISAYSILSVDVKATNSNPVRLVITEFGADGTSEGEQWQITLTGGTSFSTKVFSMSSGFTKRSDWQPAGQDNNGVFNRNNVKKIDFMQSNTSAGSMTVDNLKLTGGAATATPTPTPTVTPTPTPTSTPTPTPTFTPTPTPANKILNGEFDNGTNNWSLYNYNTNGSTIAAVTGAGLSGTYALKNTITNGGTSDWHVQIMQAFPITSGKSYKITFKAKADVAKTIKLVFQQNYSPYTHYYEQTVNVTTSAADYGTFTYNCATTDSNVMFMFFTGGNNTAVYIDKVVVTE